jgi:hypothetical protein
LCVQIRTVVSSLPLTLFSSEIKIFLMDPCSSNIQGLNIVCSGLQMELNDELFRLTDVATEAIYPDAMIADCYIYLFNLANKVPC